MKKIILLLTFCISVNVHSSPIGGINKVTEPAFRMQVSADSFHAATEMELIEWGDSLKTGDHGFMGILFQDGSQVKMAGNTEVHLQIPEEGKTTKRFNLKFGDFWARISRTDAILEIYTPSSVASVKGTKFWILVSPDGNSRLLCQEGLVDFKNTISGMSMMVAAGQMCSSNMDGTLEITDVNPEGEGESQEPESPDSIPPPAPKGEGQSGAPSPTGGATTPPPPPPEPSSGGGVGLGVNGAVGATSINGINYQYFSLRPDISIWRFGIGLDLAVYFDADGNIREEDWDEAADYIDKIYYLRYGKSGDPLYVRAGSLSPITLGYGLIMRRYTNSIEWPQVRRIGMQFEIRRGPFTIEGLINNFRELDTPGLIGARLTYERNIILPVVFGGTIVHDGNQYLGAKDEDDDGIPNQWDMFQGKNDYNHISWLEGVLQPWQIDELISSGDLPDINNPPVSIEDLDAPVTEWGIDVGVPLIRTKVMNLWVYAQMAKIVDYGSGFTLPGVSFNLGPFHAGAEYRIFNSEFMPDFFDMAYETERVVWEADSMDYLTKDKSLIGIPSAQGYYAEAGFNFFDLIDLFAAYQEMAYEGSIPGKTLYGQVSINTKFIPKLELAEGYYQQPNADDIFKTKSDGTVIGYRLGLGLGSGVMLVYDNKTIYYNGEPNKIMTVETAFTF